MTDRTKLRFDRVDVNDLEVHYGSWGSPSDPPVVCVHGFSRTGRDFDALAEFLAPRFWVLCPDLPGRGNSEWSRTPDVDYTPRALAGTLVRWCDELGLEEIRWVGTSMGGTLGIHLAGSSLSDRISHLVVNDVGPADPDQVEEGVERIVSYLTSPPNFRTLAGLESYYRDIYADMSSMTDAEWHRYTRTSARRRDDGTWTPGYHVETVEPYMHSLGELDLWERWDSIEAPVLLIRGEESDILPGEIAQAMRERGPDVEFLSVPDCGHAPMLNVPDQQEPLRDFLAR